MRKLVKILALAAVLLVSGNAFAQGEWKDVIYCKNGSVVKGMIIEQIPNESVKIQTSDGNIFVYKMSEVEKMTKEQVQMPVQQQQYQNYNQQQNNYNQQYNNQQYNNQQNNNNPYNQQNNFNNQYQMNKGPRYRGFIDLGYTLGVGEGSDYDRIEILSTHGCQFNRYFFLGAGAGLSIFIDGFVFVPIYADARIQFPNRTNSMSFFIDYKIGMNVTEANFYMAPSIGWHVAFGQRGGMSVSFGYVLQMAEYYYSDSYYSYGYTDNCGGLGWKISFDF